jgi:hypothetical protein
MDFGDGLRAIKRGERITKKDWQGSMLELQTVRVSGNVETPYIFKVDDTTKTPWHPQQADILSRDWVIVK